MTETVLITGASGFLGSHLVKGCLNAGYAVAAYKRSHSNLWRLQNFTDRVVWFDLERNDIASPFEKLQINHVVHAATMYGNKQELLSEVIKFNVLFPIRLLECATSAKAATFFNTDTFFNTGNILYKYLNFYALSKKQVVEWLNCIDAGATKIINMKLQHMYGHHDNPEKFVPSIIRQCLSSVAEIKLTPGLQERDFIFIDDVVSAYLCLLHKYPQITNSFSSFDVGTGRATTIREFIEIISKITNSKTKLLFGSLPYRENEIMTSVADNAALLKFGWTPRFSVAAGIEQVVHQTI
jgi:CDP-paratose synthetase